MSQRIIAMWSGPRNISTALMRSWASRPDTRVIDEPFYAHYLQETGYNHPGADEIIASYETDWRLVIDQLLTNDNRKAIFYQKHMTQHMLQHIDRAWLSEIANCFLIREPRRMLLSFAKVIPEPRLDQTGLPQQVELFNYVKRASGQAPPVVAARDVLRNPEGTLRCLCAALDIAFDPAMLRWRPGAHASDGVWAKHWYASVERSTSFAPYQADDTPAPENMRALLEDCQRLYDQMAPYCIGQDD